MGARRPIATAPQDGKKITVYWTDRDGQENETIAHYRSLDRLKAGGGDWDESDAGWWAAVDGDTQKKIDPHSWESSSDDEDD
jgi:hypothetical protein